MNKILCICLFISLCCNFGLTWLVFALAYHLEIDTKNIKEVDGKDDCNYSHYYD